MKNYNSDITERTDLIFVNDVVICGVIKEKDLPRHGRRDETVHLMNFKRESSKRNSRKTRYLGLDG